MTAVGDIEFNAQRRGIALFRDRLGYEYLGDWQDWEDKVRVSRRPRWFGTERKSQSGR